MPTVMMAGLQSHALAFAKNYATTMSPLNPYLESGSSIRNPIRMGKLQQGFIYGPLIMPTLTIDSLATMRQQWTKETMKW